MYIRENRGFRKAFRDGGNIGTRMINGGLKTRASQRKLKLTNIVMLALVRHKDLLKSPGRTIQPDDFEVLGVRGKPMHEASLYKFYNQICAEHGLRHIRIHDHRHTAAVIALSNKVDPIVTSYGLGHASFEITKRIYAQAVPMLSTEFSERIADALMPVELGGGGAMTREGSNV